MARFNYQMIFTATIKFGKNLKMLHNNPNEITIKKESFLFEKKRKKEMIILRIIDEFKMF